MSERGEVFSPSSPPSGDESRKCHCEFVGPFFSVYPFCTFRVLFLLFYFFAHLISLSTASDPALYFKYRKSATKENAVRFVKAKGTVKIDSYILLPFAIWELKKKKNIRDLLKACWSVLHYTCAFSGMRKKNSMYFRGAFIENAVLSHFAFHLVYIVFCVTNLFIFESIR